MGADITIDLISYGTAAIAFTFLAALLLASWKRGRIGSWLVAAAALTAVWAALESWAVISDREGVALAAVLLDVLRMACWFGLLLALMALSWNPTRLRGGRDVVVPAIGLLVIANLALHLGVTRGAATVWGIPVAEADILARLSLAIVGLLLVENLFRNTAPEQRWNIKFLCLGVGGMFAYDFFLYSEALLYKRINPELLGARGFIHAIVMPLLAISAARNPKWSLEVFISRRAIFHSTTLISAGVYLLAMAMAGYFLRRYSGDWGGVLQAVFLFGAIIVLALVIFSGRFRAWAMLNLNKHFLTYRYDYREEWLRLIRTISTTARDGGLPQRVINAVADVVDSPDGVLWLREPGGRFVLGGNWNTSSWKLEPGSSPADPGFAALLEERQWIVNLNELTSDASRYPGLVVPEWITKPERAWLIVPLLHHEWLLGVLVLGRPRVARDLNWEDYDLLKTIGRQAASYLAEHQAARALAEARQFEQFNKRFAFVLHDIKNLASQLSLITANAEKFKANPAFVDDMVVTVRETVDKMNRLMTRIHEGGREAKSHAPFELAGLLRQTVERAASKDRTVSFEDAADGMRLLADEDRFAAVVSHLIDNAIEASPAHEGRVSVRLSTEGGEAVIEVEDNGKGMEPDFIRNEMFKPFKSTKADGYGIGAYESREFVRELGGNLDVVSAPGKGTTVRIRLPALAGYEQGVKSERRVISR
jgi:putative PEP-CTERM system histidine kinase